MLGIHPKRMIIRSYRLTSILLLMIQLTTAAFNPDTADYNAYGIKMAMTDHFLVLANNHPSTPNFFVQHSPFYQVNTSRQCHIDYPNSTASIFVYTVAVGKHQSQTQKHFFFAGEGMGDTTRIFVGLANYNESLSSSPTNSCDINRYSYVVRYLPYTEHQEHYILAARKDGKRVYGFTNRFLFMFDSENPSIIDTWDGNLTWPNSSFLPYAVDVADGFAVIAGFVRNSPSHRVHYRPVIYLMNLNTSTGRPEVVNINQPEPTPGTWQDLLTNSDANIYSAKYDMSVAINDTGSVLVGMQFINRVFLFSVNIKNPVSLEFVSRHTNGRSIGNGKSITWLEDGMVAVMINTYSLSYQWSVSQLLLYDIKSDGYYNSTSIPVSVYPNSHQIIPEGYSAVFLHVISSPSTTLVLLNSAGQLLIFSPTEAGYYAQIDAETANPVTTVSQSCVAGSYKNKRGIHDCSLCPTGTKNPGNETTRCVACSSSSYCSLGAVADVPQSFLKTTSQVIPYPESPEATTFDEVLLQNMFSIGTGRCLLISPLFWSLIVAGVVLVIVSFIEVLNIFRVHRRSKTAKNLIKRTLRHSDFIGEGEYWVGGLASISVIVVVVFAFSFSGSYIRQYPIETATDSYFACDPKLRNAKFDTNALSLAIPFSKEEQQMADMLNSQKFTLYIDLINTVVNCDAISIQGLIGTAWITVRWESCNNTNAILTLSIPLAFQFISIEVSIDSSITIGALRTSIYGPERSMQHYTLHQLQFYRSFSKAGEILARTLPISIALTKVFNETKSLDVGESDFSGIFIPTFSFDSNSLFVSRDQYVRSSLAKTTLSVTISETPYYVKNVQQPIARLSEVIFRDILFAIVCVEIFGFFYLFFKLVFKPLYHLIRRKSWSKICKHPKEDKPIDLNATAVTTLSANDENDNDIISFSF